MSYSSIFTKEFKTNNRKSKSRPKCEMWNKLNQYCRDKGIISYESDTVSIEQIDIAKNISLTNQQENKDDLL
jgi:hypothetical protein